MKIEFPLWVVLDPKPGDDLRDVRWEAVNFAGLECTLGGGVFAQRPYYERNPALYTTEAEATADAQARLDARDGKGDWIPLREALPAAIFETKNGARVIKTLYGNVVVVGGTCGPDQQHSVLDNTTLVREIKLF